MTRKRIENLECGDCREPLMIAVAVCSRHIDVLLMEEEKNAALEAGVCNGEFMMPRDIAIVK